MRLYVILLQLSPNLVVHQIRIDLKSMKGMDVTEKNVIRAHSTCPARGNSQARFSDTHRQSALRDGLVPQPGEQYKAGVERCVWLLAESLQGFESPFQGFLQDGGKRGIPREELWGRQRPLPHTPLQKQLLVCSS